MDAQACRRCGWIVAAVLLVLASRAGAQAGRVGGVIVDDRGQPLRGATIRAENVDAFPRTLTGTSDSKGRFAFIGLRSGVWKFNVECPGFLPSEFLMAVRAAAPGRPIAVPLTRNASLILDGPLAGVDAKLLRGELRAADEAFTKGDMDAAITGYNAVLSRAPALTLVRLQIGNAYRQKKDTAKAIEAYEAVLKAEPTNGIGLYRLAEIRLAEGQLPAARELYERAATADPDWTKPLLRLGTMALDSGDNDAAVARLGRVRQLDPDSADAMTADSLLSRISR